MDQATLNILCGLIANGLTSILGQAFSSLAGGGGQREAISHLVRQDAELSTTLQKAAAAVARSARLSGQGRAEKLRTFLCSPDVEAIVRQIFASEMGSDEPVSYTEPLKAAFTASLSLYLGQDVTPVSGVADELFGDLVNGCKRALTAATEKGSLGAHEALSVFRHRIIVDELAGLQKNLDLLTASKKPNLQAILTFEKRYRQQVGVRHRFIIPPHFDAARKVPIDDIYVASNFFTSPNRKGEEPKPVKVSDFLACAYRDVLLGNPGGGKSTLAQKLCHDLATKYDERLYAGRQVTPVLVIVREYGARKKTSNCSIVEFIEETANSRYLVRPPQGAFEYLFLNGRTIVVFDGLDELLETSYREEISGDIEAFCDLYPALPVLVTSREVGYEQAPLDDKRFTIYRLSPFDEGQVSDYARKWFAVDKDLSPDEQEQKSRAFLEESRIVPDLRGNPLMLGLMCNIYRGENYIPRNRPEVYEKCATMLFERWDKSRGIFVPQAMEAYIKPAMQYLAHWIYSDEALQGGVTEDGLIAKASEYLQEWRFDNLPEAEKAAREFIEFCKGRAWVFTDTGTTKEGGRLYQFTHRTFLEYFTAAYLVRTKRTPEELGAFLRPKISTREWDVVAQLAFQIQNNNIQGAGDELLNDTISEAKKTMSAEGLHLLSFAARCLEFLVPRPKTARELAAVCLDRCMDWRLEQSRQDEKTAGAGALEIFPALVLCAAENRSTVSNVVQAALINRINNGEERESVLAVDLGMHLTWFIGWGNGRQMVPRDVRDFWHEVSNQIYQACSKRIESLARSHFLPCNEAFQRQRITAEELLKWHGTGEFYQGEPSAIFPRYWPLSPAQTLLHMATFSSSPSMDAPGQRWEVSQLRDIGRILSTYPTPWVVREHDRAIGFPSWVLELPKKERNRSKRRLALDPNAMFGAFLTAAPLFEAIDEWEIRRLAQTLRTTKVPLFVSLGPLLLARIGQAEPSAAGRAIKQAEFSTTQRDLIERWIRKQLSFVHVQSVDDNEKE